MYLRKEGHQLEMRTAIVRIESESADLGWVAEAEVVYELDLFRRHRQATHLRRSEMRTTLVRKESEVGG